MKGVTGAGLGCKDQRKKTVKGVTGRAWVARINVNLHCIAGLIELKFVELKHGKAPCCGA